MNPHLGAGRRQPALLAVGRDQTDCDPDGLVAFRGKKNLTRVFFYRRHGMGKIAVAIIFADDDDALRVDTAQERLELCQKILDVVFIVGRIFNNIHKTFFFDKVPAVQGKGRILRYAPVFSWHLSSRYVDSGKF